MKRFWDKVNKTEGCWIWAAMKVNRGKETYGGYGGSAGMQHPQLTSGTLILEVKSGPYNNKEGDKEMIL